MYNNELFRKLENVIKKFPENIYFDINSSDIGIQCATQKMVRTIRQCFPGCIWSKNHNGNWWEYTSTFNEIKVKIYAVTEAPPTCKMVYEDKEVEERVPIAYETRKVVKRVLVRTECNESEL